MLEELVLQRAMSARKIANRLKANMEDEDRSLICGLCFGVWLWGVVGINIYPYL